MVFGYLMKHYSCVIRYMKFLIICIIKWHRSKSFIGENLVGIFFIFVNEESVKFVSHLQVTFRVKLIISRLKYLILARNHIWSYYARLTFLDPVFLEPKVHDFMVHPPYVNMATSLNILFYVIYKLALLLLLASFLPESSFESSR